MCMDSYSMTYLQPETKKMTLAKKWAKNKNPQFWSNQPEIKAILPNHGLVILTKFHYNCVKIVDFLLLDKFYA